jgi:hypothetical protein
MSGYRFCYAQGPDKNVRGQVAPNANAHATDLHETGTAALQHGHAAASVDAKLGQAMHPARLARDLGDVTPIAVV